MLLTETYIDDRKIYLSFSAKDLDTFTTEVADILLINPRKLTEVIVFGTWQLVSKLADFQISLLGQNLVPEPYVKDLGILLDANLSFNEHSVIGVLGAHVYVYMGISQNVGCSKVFEIQPFRGVFEHPPF